MRFIDEVNIEVSSGNGGSGCVSFRREKFIPFGGPDGGNGGHGGSVVFEATDDLNTLVNFRGRRRYDARPGQAGMGKQRDGRAGDDIVLKVPVGTQIKTAENDFLIKDLLEDGESFVLAKGGRGGLGNMFFKSSTNQTPRYSQEGEEGENFELKLELKLLADIAFVGLPNAGKSTLISALSAARPKIADYPFTTLKPNLGVVKIRDDKSLVVADIPGLIEGAHEGKGLGIKFLKHLDRAQALVHLVDISWCLDEYEAYESYTTIRNELERYSKNLSLKKEVVCLTKVDAMTDEEIEKYITFFETTLDRKVIALSAVSQHNISLLKDVMWDVKQTQVGEVNE